jgi:RHS repeat-associated protein
MEGPVSFTYNADGQRVRKETPTETKKYLFDFRKLLAETDDVDNPLVEFTQTLDEYGDLISEFDDSGATTSYHAYDAQWSTEALLDSADNVTDRYQYTAFGLQTHSEGTSDSPLTFVGKQNYYRDNEIDLYMLGLGGQPLTHQPTHQKAGRQYDPATGQPTSPDPLGVDTDPEGNLYVYSGNNPVNDIDPSGQQPDPLIVTDEFREEYRERILERNKAYNAQLKQYAKDNPDNLYAELDSHFALATTDPDKISFNYGQVLAEHYGTRPYTSSPNYRDVIVYRVSYASENRGLNYRYDLYGLPGAASEVTEGYLAGQRQVWQLLAGLSCRLFWVY